MKDYQKALLILEEQATPKAKHNKLIKIALETQDDELGSLCKKSATMYGYYIERKYSRTLQDEKLIGVIPRSNDEWRSMQQAINNQLREYIQFRLSQQKPTWQVMAEKQGWESKSDLDRQELKYTTFLQLVTEFQTRMHTIKRKGLNATDYKTLGAELQSKTGLTVPEINSILHNDAEEILKIMKRL